MNLDGLGESTARMTAATTKEYVARHTAEGKSSREIRRCLKRYIARELDRALNASTTLTDQTSQLRRQLDKH